MECPLTFSVPEWKTAVDGYYQKKLYMRGRICVGPLFAGFLLPKEEPKNPDIMLRIGAGDDISGLFLEEVETESEGGLILSDDFMEGYEFKDC